MRRQCYFVYIMASKSRVLYTGVCKSLDRRVFEYKNDLIEGFTKEYRSHRLVHVESFDDVRNAIDREKQLKRWRREKKVWLIERRNPTWEDLAEGLSEGEEQQVPSTAERLGGAVAFFRSG